MKKVAAHFTQTKKTYRQPVMKRFGSVKKLTKGKLGSIFDGIGNPEEFDGN
ncbi:hypothetical protein [Dyadobacter bucti]|uniref:hypothetical protein n=1 Tax=Dyadobacter bucti TaxID=2572203 RepID=UPI003F713E3B